MSEIKAYEIGNFLTSNEQVIMIAYLLVAAFLAFEVLKSINENIKVSKNGAAFMQALTVMGILSMFVVVPNSWSVLIRSLKGEELQQVETPEWSPDPSAQTFVRTGKSDSASPRSGRERTETAIQPKPIASPEAQPTLVQVGRSIEKTSPRAKEQSLENSAATGACHDKSGKH
jgi:hypothetical protein